MPFWAWIVVAFGAAAAWGFTVVLNKRTLQYLDPFALNLIVRVPTFVQLAIVGALLTITGAWDLGFKMTWAAVGYMTISAVITWLIAFSAYYVVLRIGAIGIVTPIIATDPLFTAVFAVVLLGSGLGTLLVSGLVISTVGIVLLSRWMDDTVGGPSATVDAAPLVDPEAVPPQAGAAASSRLKVIVLSLTAALGWGLAPVVIERATESVGGASVTIMLQSQAMGFLLLLPIVLKRRRITLRPLTRPERRDVVRLVLVSSVLEMLFTVSYYLLIDEIGSVLTVLITACSPVFSILGGRWLLHEHYRWKLAVAAAITLAGVAIATLQGM